MTSPFSLTSRSQYNITRRSLGLHWILKLYKCVLTCTIIQHIPYLVILDVGTEYRVTHRCVFAVGSGNDVVSTANDTARKPESLAQMKLHMCNFT